MARPSLLKAKATPTAQRNSQLPSSAPLIEWPDGAPMPRSLHSQSVVPAAFPDIAHGESFMIYL